MQFAKELLTAAIAVLLSGPARAGLLASEMSGTDTNETGYFGQSVTTPTGGPFDDITFNFISTNGDPFASGTLYVFSSFYNGTPDALAGAGALATSIGVSNGQYIFSPDFTLSGGHQYSFYEDTLLATGSITGDVPYLGGGDHYASSATMNFSNPPPIAASNFVLNGDPVSVPASMVPSDHKPAE